MFDYVAWIALAGSSADRLVNSLVIFGPIFKGSRSLYRICIYQWVYVHAAAAPAVFPESECAQSRAPKIKTFSFIPAGFLSGGFLYTRPRLFMQVVAWD